MAYPKQLKVKKVALVVGLGLLLGGCASTPTHLGMGAALMAPPSKAGYFPLQVQNNVGPGAATNGVTNVYLMMVGEQLDGSSQCLMNLTQDTSVSGYNAWIGTCQNLTLQTKASQYSYTMSSLQVNPSEPVVIYVPNVISGRAYVSLNYPLDIPMTRAANGSISIQAPSLSNPDDGNYNLIYDKFEYTYDNTNTMWVDNTSVDDFALPISLSYGTQLAGYTNQTRDQVIAGIESYLNNGNSDWQNLIVKDSVSGTGTTMRIDAPNVAPKFNPNYLTSPAGFNYVNALIHYYSQSGNTLAIDCSEVGAGTYTGSVQGTQFVFTGSGSPVSIDLSKASSEEFFGPGQAPLDTPNKTVRSVIVKNLTAAVSVGVLPGASSLNSTYFANSESAGNVYYQTNTILQGSPYNAYSQSPTGKGPWYNLYAQAIHKTAANPVYAFAFDDVLKQDGTLSIPNTNPGPTTTPVIVTFGSVGNLQVPQPGPFYTANPTPNDIEPVTNVKQTGFSCSGNNCTLSASWEIPAYQDTSVRYFILPTPSPVETKRILENEVPLADYGATSMSVTFPVPPPAPSSVSQVTVYACIPNSETTAKGYDCPSDGNGYTFGPSVVGASSPATGVILLPVTPTSNSGFSCNGTTCTLNASWTIPSGQPTGTIYYINPLKNSVSMPDIMNGQSPAGGTTGSSGTLTLPQSEVTTQAAPIIVMACINSGGKYCPSSSNGYNQSQAVGSAILQPSN